MGKDFSLDCFGVDLTACNANAILWCHRDRKDSRSASWRLEKGMGILKVAKLLGIGTGTVQRISREQ